MKTQILLTVDYTGNENYWVESSIKNKEFTIDTDKNIHDQIAEIIKEIDYCELLYKNKPKGNIYIDLKSGGSKKVGYVYRGKHEIQKEDGYSWAKQNFDVWVGIKAISDFKILDVE